MRPKIQARLQQAISQERYRQIARKRKRRAGAWLVGLRDLAYLIVLLAFLFIITSYLVAGGHLW